MKFWICQALGIAFFLHGILPAQEAAPTVIAPLKAIEAVPIKVVKFEDATLTAVISYLRMRWERRPGKVSINLDAKAFPKDSRLSIDMEDTNGAEALETVAELMSGVIVETGTGLIMTTKERGVLLKERWKQWDVSEATLAGAAKDTHVALEETRVRSLALRRSTFKDAVRFLERRLRNGPAIRLAPDVDASLRLDLVLADASMLETVRMLSLVADVDYTIDDEGVLLRPNPKPAPQE